MSTPVIWLGLDPSQRASYWDCTILSDMFAGHLGTPLGWPEFEHTNSAAMARPGCVVIVPGAEYRDKTALINDIIEQADGRCVIMVVKDEGSTFPWRNIDLAQSRLWLQNPPAGTDGHVRPLPVGWTPATRAAKERHSGEKTRDWFFSGQVTHARRKQCVRQLKELPCGDLHETAGFLQGMPVDEYLDKMAAAMVAPCPGGVIPPDSFRVWEALELGAVPIADTIGGRGDGHGYWQGLLRGPIPFPVIEDWMEAPLLIGQCVEAYPAVHNQVQAWWSGWKRRLVHQLNDDIHETGDPDAEYGKRPGDRLTVLIPTSSIPSHPSTAIIEETLGSIRTRPELEGCEIIIMADGLRDAHQAREKDYAAYLSALNRIVDRTHNCSLTLFDKPVHQSGMAREVLPQVRTPAILYVEHDTPVIGDIPWEPLIDACVSGDADAVRLHHEAQVLDVHMHLMPDGRNTHEVAGVPMVRCVQWSQRPHVANTGFYRRILDEHFTLNRTNMFIEDRMHSVLEVAWKKHGMAGWHRYRLWMYHPEGDIKRSTHLDGRAGEAKVG